MAIRGVRVGGSLDHAEILAGYDVNGLAVNGAVRIGKVAVVGNWSASDLVAGAIPGDDGLFGTDDDISIASQSAIVSRIASVLIAGEVVGTEDASDHFGIVAAQINAAQNGDRDIALKRGPGNDIDVRVGIADDVRLTEVGE